MYARRLAIVLVFFSFASRGECQQVDAKKLCELIRTPKGSMLIGIGFNTQRGFVIAGESTDHSAEIAALEKALCGDAMDAERYYRLSELYDDEDKCKQASAKAADLFWKQLQADPRNGRLAMRLGQSLPVENEAEGERLLRLAVQLAPKDGECWMALGDFLWGKIFDALLTPTTRGMSQMETLMNIVITRSVPKENLQAAYKIANEANACMEKAVTVAPRQPRHYVARALSRSLNIVLDEGSRALADDKRDLVDCMCRIVEQLSQRKVIADIQKAAELEPTNPRAQVFAGAVELLPLFGNELAKLKTGDDAAKARFIQELSVQGMRAGDKLMDKLDPLTRHPDKRVVAEACYFEALLLSLKAAMTKDKKTSQPNLARIETLLRRSVELQPGNQSAWDILMAAVSAQEKKDKELIELCEARLRARDDARNRFFVAKVFEEMNRYADAEKHLRAGIKCNESSTFNHVGLAAVLLRSNDPKRRPEALEHLEKAEELLAKNEYAALSDDVSVLRAVNTALTGDPALARVMLESVLGRDEKHDMAGKMLKVLDR